MISSNISSINANQTFMDNSANNIANLNTNNFKSTDTIIKSSNDNVEAFSLKKIVDINKINNTQNINEINKVSETNLTKEMIDQINIENTTKVNLQSIRTQNNMLGSLLDIKV
jgi:flagellar hook protein FlgE